ncbi:hypothetical protein ACP4OV_018684 [Aristida adscensionis]
MHRALGSAHSCAFAMDAASAASGSALISASRGAGGGAGMGRLRRPQPPLPWLQVATAVAAPAADGGRDVLGRPAAAAKAGKKRRSPAWAGVARGVKVFVSGAVAMVGKRFERSIPAAKFGHVAYIR